MSRAAYAFPPLDSSASNASAANATEELAKLLESAGVNSTNATAALVLRGR